MLKPHPSAYPEVGRRIQLLPSFIDSIGMHSTHVHPQPNTANPKTTTAPINLSPASY